MLRSLYLNSSKLAQRLTKFLVSGISRTNIGTLFENVFKKCNINGMN